MAPMQLGVICGLAFGVVNALIILFAPITWESPRQKRDGLVATFAGRFMIGFLIPLVDLGVPPILKGILISIGISLSPAIISRRYAPILIIGIIGGAIIGWIAG
jgi:hypothetical protein